ncbi:AMP-binding protein [Streptomyces sp. NRRL F-4489]|uniref:class I adenylate-forming enzyme family protein n=1 Tax=Streptomyces sp. NRRL F-4489 TaxID=1609095 RepID=UPI0007476C91|nr:class I adenylate-forming enzyme family protein [Streptomyces sp. NRRL F-4489]KUL35395.1 AMP-binding protein [Streptomyces sp. NRRL F-4489]
MTLSARTLLPAGLRARLAADPGLGGGTVLESALAHSPAPDAPFLACPRPLPVCGGGLRGEFSLLDLDRLVQSWAVWYADQGVRPRDRVAVQLPDSFAYSVHLHALARLGAIAVLINSKAPRETALELIRRTEPVGLYTTRDRLAALGGDLARLPGPRWTELAEDVPAPEAAELPGRLRFRHAPDDPVSILHSSGTTGVPKPVVQTHASSVAGPRFRLTHATDAPHELMMAAQPQSHLGSVVYAQYALLAGTPMVALYDPSGPELLAAVQEHRPTSVMAFAHAFAELAELDAPDGALDSVDSWVTMGDAIHEAHLKAILGRRAPDLPSAVFYDRFGATELGWGVMVHPRSLGSRRNDRCIGRPDALSEVVVLRRDGTRADTGEVGLLGVKGPTVTAGYWNDSDTTYRSRLAGYWLSGDLAYQDEAGDFYQLDRAVDAVETAEGIAHSVHMEEFLLSEVPALADCAVVGGGTGGRTVLVAVVTTGGTARPRPETLLASANKVLREAGHQELAALELARGGEDFPQGVTGKVLKRRLREKYAELDRYLRDCDTDAVAWTLDAG